MRVLFIFPVMNRTTELMKRLKCSLNQIMAVRFVEGSEFTAPNFDIQFVMLSTNSDFKSNRFIMKLIADSDLAVSYVLHSAQSSCEYKIFKDRKNGVRDVSEAELFLTIGQNYGFYRSELANQLERAERESSVTDLTNQIESVLQSLHTPTDQSVELNKIRELLAAIEEINK